MWRSSAGMDASKGAAPKGKANKGAQQLESQMRRLQLRKDGNAEMAKALGMVDDALAIEDLDRTPCLPGEWTAELHSRVMKVLDKAEAHWDTGKKHYEDGFAEEINGKCVDVRAAIDAARDRTVHIKEAELHLQHAEEAMQSAVHLGWPWGKEKFEEAEALLSDALSEFDLAGEAGVDEESGRPRFKGTKLHKTRGRILLARKACERLRAPVELQLQQLRNSSARARPTPAPAPPQPRPLPRASRPRRAARADRSARRRQAERRLAALRALGDCGRLPVPMRVAYLGALERADGAGAEGPPGARGDAEVVACVLAMTRDAEWRVRLETVAVLARVCARGDPTVSRAIAALVDDPVANVRDGATRALVQTAGRGAALSLDTLLAKLRDPQAPRPSRPSLPY